MVSLNLRYFDVPKVTEHELWVYGDTVFLERLKTFIENIHNGLYPQFKFRVDDTKMFVQVHLSGKPKEFTPGEYQSEFDRILAHCRGFEAGWGARRQP